MKKSIFSLTLVCSIAASFALDASLNPQPASSADRLMRMVRAAGVSGFEGEACEEIKSQLPAWAQARVDEIGNLIVTLGSGNPRTLVAAPLDEDGHVVSGITNEGYLRVHRVTSGASHRLFDQFHYGQPVVITNRRGEKIPAVTATLSTHLQQRAAQGEMERIRTLDDLWVDLGAQSKEEIERLGIRNLDPVTLRERGQYLANNRLAGVAMQSRAAAFALVELLRASDPASTDAMFVWTAQSQFGARGLARIAQQMKPDRVLLLGRTVMTPASSIDARGSAGQFGAGPLIASAELKALADQNQVPAQTVPDSRLQFRPPANWQGVKIHTLSLPVLFAQTPVETVALSDVEAMVRLTRAFTGLKPASSPSTGASSTRVVADDKPVTDAFDILRELIEVYGVSGHEAPVRERIKQLLPAWAKAQTDEKGNLSVTFGKGGKEMLFVAHMDEVGYEITSIREDGTATVRKRGGFFDSIYEAHPAIVHTARGPVNAVIAPRPNYFQADRFQPAQDTIYVYLGTDSRQQAESLGVRAGDAVTVRKEFARLASMRATGRSMDDRVGSAALIAALRAIDPNRLNNRVTFAWVVEEEVGLNGAAFMAERFHPPYVFAVDTFVSSDSPVDPQRTAFARLGSGAVARAMDNASITPAELVDRIAMIARKRSLPLYVGTTGGGTDGSAFTRFGSINLPISWPGRYSHSPVEVMDRRDMESLIQLILALAQEF
ncbi:MAG: M20/M25/M40 family metallo-hydrolase [Acidobacteriota bacterium]